MEGELTINLGYLGRGEIDPRVAYLRMSSSPVGSLGTSIRSTNIEVKELKLSIPLRSLTSYHLLPPNETSILGCLPERS